jgi:hypothetical protein
MEFLMNQLLDFEAEKSSKKLKKLKQDGKTWERLSNKQKGGEKSLGLRSLRL